MSNASLKEQLQAIAPQLSDTVGKKNKATHKTKYAAKPVKQKPRWLEYVQYGVELLKAYFPACFKSGNEIRPLKKGFKQDLVKRLSGMAEIVTEDKACMVKSLSYYVNTAAYHKSVVEGVTRVDIDGNPAGVVTAEEAKYSNERQQAKMFSKNVMPAQQSTDAERISTE